MQLELIDKWLAADQEQRDEESKLAKVDCEVTEMCDRTHFYEVFLLMAQKLKTYEARLKHARAALKCMQGS